MQTAMMVLANGEGQVGVAPAIEKLRGGDSALDAIEHGIRAVESDTRIRTVGKGGDPNLLGEVECDAAIMDGKDLRAGAVGALQGYLHAISVARCVMEQLPHVLVVGAGAARFAQESGAQAERLLTDTIRADHEHWLAEHVPARQLDRWPHGPLLPHVWKSAREHAAKGTTVFLARDGAGNLAGGASTSGWSHKYPGRLGDSAIIGAGLYVDNRYGACGCTHTGEMAIRAATARSVVLYMKRGASVSQACHEALDDLRGLHGGHLGPLVMHAIDSDGVPYVLSTHDLGERIVYCHWTEEMPRMDCARPAVESL
jgi:L-asparaginase